jgi:uncharacterized protein (DUF2267 family)
MRNWDFPMKNVGIATLGAVAGASITVILILLWFGWGSPLQGQSAHIDPVRSDYVDLLLTIATVFLGAVGLAVTVGALVIGIVALKTLREIKDEATSEAKKAAGLTINDTIRAELDPSVAEKVQAALPVALHHALLKDELGHRILSDMAGRGELDTVLERVAMRIQGGGPEVDTEEDSAPLRARNNSD